MSQPHRPAHQNQLHRDGRVWAGVFLMLAAMAIYVLSLDDSMLR